MRELFHGEPRGWKRDHYIEPVLTANTINKHDIFWNSTQVKPARCYVSSSILTFEFYLHYHNYSESGCHLCTAMLMLKYRAILLYNMLKPRNVSKWWNMSRKHHQQYWRSRQENKIKMNGVCVISREESVYSNVSPVDPVPHSHQSQVQTNHLDQTSKSILPGWLYAVSLTGCLFGYCIRDSILLGPHHQPLWYTVLTCFENVPVYECGRAE